MIGAFKKAGYEDVEFYDIDALRPTYPEVLDHITKYRPDVLGVSAVVSTAYEFTKRLTLDVKRLLPDTTILLGGNLGASAEILLRKTGVDFIAVGEGERVSVDFVSAYRTAQRRSDYSNVRGLICLDGDRLENTGYVGPVPKEELYDVEWSVLEEHSK